MEWISSSKWALRALRLDDPQLRYAQYVLFEAVSTLLLFTKLCTIQVKITDCGVL